MEAEEKAMTEAIQEKGAETQIPRGLGPLTFEVLRREVGDWSHFTNRRQVSSHTGLYPREHCSGGKRRGGSVSKKGNPRVRAMLVELVWRMMRWQPDYHGLKKGMPVLGDCGRSANDPARRRLWPSPGSSRSICGGSSPGRPRRTNSGYLPARCRLSSEAPIRTQSSIHHEPLSLNPL